MVGVPFRIRVGIRRGLGEKIFAIGHRRFGKAVQNIVPFFFARQAERVAAIAAPFPKPQRQ
jgi:hypothetical protein